METYINCSILADFFDNQPLPIPIGDENENLRWYSFWKYLQQETDLFIDDTINLTDNQIRFLDPLICRRRNGTKFNIKRNLLDSPYKNELKRQVPDSFYCIDIKDQQDQKRFTSKNGYLIGFFNNYLKEWERLKLYKNDSTLPVRKEIKGPVFSSWELLGKYLTPFTDVVLVDNYILSNVDLVYSNLVQIITELDKATPVKYNLLIVTYEEDRTKLNGQKLFDLLGDIKKENQWKCSLSLVFATYKVKEHDRGIFTNYLRIYSGDSFNYFDSKNEFHTKGTDIHFYSMADPDKAHAAKVALRSVAKNIILRMKQEFADTHVFGNLENRLLNYE